MHIQRCISYHFSSLHLHMFVYCQYRPLSMVLHCCQLMADWCNFFRYSCLPSLIMSLFHVFLGLSTLSSLSLSAFSLFISLSLSLWPCHSALCFCACFLFPCYLLCSVCVNCVWHICVLYILCYVGSSLITWHNAIFSTLCTVHHQLSAQDNLLVTSQVQLLKYYNTFQ